MVYNLSSTQSAGDSTQPGSTQVGSSKAGSSQAGSIQPGSTQPGSAQLRAPGSTQVGSSKAGSAQLRSPARGSPSIRPLIEYKFLLNFMRRPMRKGRRRKRSSISLIKRTGCS